MKPRGTQAQPQRAKRVRRRGPGGSEFVSVGVRCASLGARHHEASTDGRRTSARTPVVDAIAVETPGAKKGLGECRGAGGQLLARVGIVFVHASCEVGWEFGHCAYRLNNRGRPAWQRNP